MHKINVTAYLGAKVMCVVSFDDLEDMDVNLFCAGSFVGEGPWDRLEITRAIVIEND